MKDLSEEAAASRSDLATAGAALLTESGYVTTVVLGLTRDGQVDVMVSSKPAGQKHKRNLHRAIQKVTESLA